MNINLRKDRSIGTLSTIGGNESWKIFRSILKSKRIKFKYKIREILKTNKKHFDNGPRNMRRRFQSIRAWEHCQISGAM